ncbi:enhanced intracellular survival protein Eis [Kribbella sp. NPDC051587]|uniref:enhanced intracellular survival protein Eis n=1 Tax=Kribbella sp. NPDC051587 TaxID=3364119 RepID=UPI0037AFD44F
MTDALRVVDVVEEQLESVWSVRLRSFGPGGDKDEWRKTALEFLRDGRYLGVVDGDQLVAAARIWPLQQWWSGRRMPLGGVAGVVVAPEYRGRGVGSLLMRGVLQRCAEKGYPLSALFPATTVLYRHLGYEFAGAKYRFSFPAADLRVLGGKGVAVRSAGKEDAQLFIDLASKMHETQRTNGPLVWPLSEVEDWLGDDDNFAYVAEDGFVVYSWSDGGLEVSELVSGSEETTRALWATVGSGASTARTVYAVVPPTDPIHLLAEHHADLDAQVNRWMLRLIDAPAAIAQRGYPAGAVLDVALRLEDADLPANAGDWRLSVADGTGELTAAEPDDQALCLGARGLAALYAGTPMATLRASGLATGGSVAADGALDHAFGGTASYMVDDF